jgi:hypothetical protein
MDPVSEVVAEVSVVALHHLSAGEQPYVVLVDVTQDIGMEEVALVAAKWRNLPLLALGSLAPRRDYPPRPRRLRWARRYDPGPAVCHLARRRRPYAVSRRNQRRAHWGPIQPRAAADDARAPSLTRRETEVLQMICLVLSNKEIPPSTNGRNKSVVLYAKGVEPMDSSHVATGTIAALPATALFYLSKWPLQPLDLPAASAFAGLIVGVGGALVRFHKSRTALLAPPVVPVVSIAPPNLVQQPAIAA